MPNFAIIIIAIALGFCIMHSSAEKDAKQASEGVAQMENTPEHMMVSGSPHPGAIVVVVLIAVVAAFLAIR